MPVALIARQSVKAIPPVWFNKMKNFVLLVLAVAFLLQHVTSMKLLKGDTAIFIDEADQDENQEQHQEAASKMTASASE